MLVGSAYSSFLKSPSVNGALPVVTSLAFLCHLDASILGREATDLIGKSGKNKWSSCALLPHMSELPIGIGLGGGFVYHILPPLIQHYL